MEYCGVKTCVDNELVKVREFLEGDRQEFGKNPLTFAN